MNSDYFKYKKYIQNKIKSYIKTYILWLRTSDFTKKKKAEYTVLLLNIDSFEKTLMPLTLQTFANS